MSHHSHLAAMHLRIANLEAEVSLLGATIAHLKTERDEAIEAEPAKLRKARRRLADRTDKLDAERAANLALSVENRELRARCERLVEGLEYANAERKRIAGLVREAAQKPAPAAERVPDGTPGVRDPDNPCEAFIPGTPHPHGDCNTDGHYLCAECSCCNPDAVPSEHEPTEETLG